MAFVNRMQQLIIFCIVIFSFENIFSSGNPSKSTSGQNFYHHLHDIVCTRETSSVFSKPTVVLNSNPPRIIIAGAPASGKGTQCEVISNEFGVVHLSSGDILRSAVKTKSALGVLAQKYMDAGRLVPDEIIVGVIEERLKEEDCQRRGWLLDGFPRTENQAVALIRANMVPDVFILLEVPDRLLIDRVVSRRIDPITGKVYNVRQIPSMDPDVVSRLVQRSDDNEETIKIRLNEYKSHIAAVKAFFQDQVMVVDGSLPSKDVSTQVLTGVRIRLASKELRRERASAKWFSVA